MKNAVVLGLGSNASLCRNGRMLESVRILEKACRALAPFIDDMHVSSVYETPPMYVKEQKNFYNMALCGFFGGDPFELLQLTQKVEAEYGRDRLNEIRFGPRSLDIDIELFADMRIRTDSLEIPHPRLCERAFVLIPMLEILPLCADIGNRAFYENCLKSADGSGIKKFCGPFKIT